MNSNLENNSNTDLNTDTTSIIQASPDVDVTINVPVKKKRGRPRKYPIVDTTNKVKKKRGRPKGKKNKKTEKNSTVRTRGRPKKMDSVNKVYSMNNRLQKIIM